MQDAQGQGTQQRQPYWGALRIHSEVAKADKTPCTHELSEGAYAANKDPTAHDIKESGAVHLTRNTTNGTPMTDEVGKLPTDADGNNPP